MITISEKSQSGFIDVGSVNIMFHLFLSHDGQGLMIVTNLLPNTCWCLWYKGYILIEVSICLISHMPSFS